MRFFVKLLTDLYVLDKVEKWFSWIKNDLKIEAVSVVR